MMQILTRDTIRWWMEWLIPTRREIRALFPLPITKRTTMKQVIVMRTDLNMRKGKMVAQGSHATLGVFLKNDISTEGLQYAEVRSFWPKQVSEWIRTGMKKVCVGCSSEDELMSLYNKAKENDVEAYYVRDAGHTELEPNTITCVAIGPDEEEVIDKITGHLKLL